MSGKPCNKCREATAFARNGRCKSCSNQEARDYRLKNIEKVREQDRLRHIHDREKRLSLMKDYHKNNKDKRLEIERNRYQAESERIKARCAEYRENNKEKVYEWNGTRRAVMRNAMPPWAIRAEIKDFYDCAKALTKQTGIVYHVDHIIPLSHLMCVAYIYLRTLR